ncbi:MAG: hypothetical protein KDC14_07010 [Planctomycetes bacterium]|nr:hypothetical protein [Planctomycetota bacterium]
MNPADLERLQELMRVASRLPVATRAAFMQRAEPRRSDLRDEALSLLSHDDGRAELIPAQLGEEQFVGPFRLVQRIGEAPPARLYRATWTDDPQREALVAIAGPGPAASRIAIALEGQAQRQANFVDPSLARLSRAGATDDDRLYAAFESPDCIPLAELGDALRLPVEERVRLIEEVARAVHRSHAAGIAPLGLLPWSVLGSWRDDRLETSVLAVDAWPLLALLEPERRAESDLLAVLETSAPEALRGEERGVTTDVFALGALLYESVTGTPPLGLRRLAGQRTLREELRMAAKISPPLASDRIARLERAAEPLARARSTTPAALLRELRSGLDSILQRSPSSDASQRPASAGDFAAALLSWRSGRGRSLLDAARDIGRKFGFDGSSRAD